MRTTETLLELDQISIFFQYLYVREENSITYNNGIVDLTITMDNDLNVWVKNEMSPNQDPILFNDNIDPASVLSIIDILRTQPPIDHPTSSFKSRWEEIWTITTANLSLNKGKRNR